MKEITQSLILGKKKKKLNNKSKITSHSLIVSANEGITILIFQQPIWRIILFAPLLYSYTHLDMQESLHMNIKRHYNSLWVVFFHSTCRTKQSRAHQQVCFDPLVVYSTVRQFFIFFYFFLEVKVGLDTNQ